MSSNPYESPGFGQYSDTYDVAANATDEVRVQFVRRVYIHLTVAVLALIAIEFVLFTAFGSLLDGIVPMVMRGWAPFLFFGAFFFVTTAADRWAQRATNRTQQYAALSVYVIAEAIFLLPLLYIANRFYPGAIQTAGIASGVVFAGLTAGTFISKVDFSFLRMYLMLGSFAALGIILASFFVGGLTSGVIFPGLMIILACGYILYDTSRVMKHYHTDQYVAASLALFASVVLLFWYILRLIMASRR